MPLLVWKKRKNSKLEWRYHLPRELAN